MASRYLATVRRATLMPCSDRIPASSLGQVGELGSVLVLLGFLAGNGLGALVGLVPASKFVAWLFASRNPSAESTPPPGRVA